ncbi:MAG: DMT family transporter [bacterium]|nr:DMT family transporter [bacterium]
MSFLALTIIAFSGLLHALWSFFVKKSHHKLVFLWLMFATTSLILTALYLIYFRRFGFLSPSALRYALLTVCGYFIYQVAAGKAYEMEDMSLVYPLTMSAPLFVPLWARILIGERLTMRGIAGIVLCMVAVYIIPLQSLRLEAITRPFTHLKRQGVRLALLAAIADSVSNVINKMGLTSTNAFVFAYFVIACTNVLLGLLCLLHTRLRREIVKTIRLDKKYIILAGIIFAAAFPTFQLGVSLAKVSYAVPSRRISILFGVLFGVLFLKERQAARVRIVGSILLLLGIWLMKIG